MSLPHMPEEEMRRTVAKSQSTAASIQKLVRDSVYSLFHQDRDASQRTHDLCQALLRIEQGLSSTLLLSESYRCEDMWILCRVFAELAINAAYLYLAEDIERDRWANYNTFTAANFITNLQQSVRFEQPHHVAAINSAKANADQLSARNLYANARRGTWSSKSLPERAVIADEIQRLEIAVFGLIYRLSVKLGDDFVHSAPRSLGGIHVPDGVLNVPSRQRLLLTAQALAITATSAYALVNFARKQGGLESHPSSDRIGREIQEVYKETEL